MDCEKSLGHDLRQDPPSAVPRRFQFRLLLIFGFTAVVAVLAAVEAARREAAPGRKIRWWRGRFVGCSRAEVVKRMGLPAHEVENHFGNPPASYIKLHPVVKILVYSQPGGELYVSFERRGSKWLAFECSFLPAGAVWE